MRLGLRSCWIVAAADRWARPAPGVQFADATKARGHRLHAPELRHVEQVPASRPWAAAWRCWTTTTTAGSMCSSRTARRSTTRCRRQAARQVRPCVLEPAVSPDSRRHVRRRHARRRGLTGMPQNRYGMGVAVGDYDNDGFDDLYVTELRRQHAVSQQRRRHVHRRDRAAPASRAAAGARARASSTTTTTASSICSSRATWTGRFRTTVTAARRSPATAPTAIRTTSSGMTNLLFHNNGDGTFTDVSAEGRHRRSRRARGSASPFADYDDDGFMDVYVANDSVQSLPVPQQRATARSRRSACSPASASTRTARPSPAWASTSPTTTTTAVPTSSSPICPTSATCCSGRTATAASGT